MLKEPTKSDFKCFEEVLADYEVALMDNKQEKRSIRFDLEKRIKIAENAKEPREGGIRKMKERLSEILDSYVVLKEKEQQTKMEKNRENPNPQS